MHCANRYIKLFLFLSLDSMVEMSLDIFGVFIINIDNTNMVLGEVLYQRRILNVRMSLGLMDAHQRASHTTIGGPTYTTFLMDNEYKNTIARGIMDPGCCLFDSKYSVEQGWFQMIC